MVLLEIKIESQNVQICQMHFDQQGILQELKMVASLKELISIFLAGTTRFSLNWTLSFVTIPKRRYTTLKMMQTNGIFGCAV